MQIKHSELSPVTLQRMLSPQQRDQGLQQGIQGDTHTVGRLATVVGTVIVRTGSACGASGVSERGGETVVGCSDVGNRKRRWTSIRRIYPWSGN